MWLLSAVGVRSVWSVMCVHSVRHNEGRTCMFDFAVTAIHAFTLLDCVWDETVYCKSLSSFGAFISAVALSVDKVDMKFKQVENLLYFPLLFPELPEERHSANKAAKRVETKALVSKKPTSAHHYQTITKALWNAHPSPAAPSCRALKSIAMYHSWNFSLLIPYHVERLFIALLEAIPHQLLASSSREESVFQTLPCGGCWSQASLFLAVLKHSIPGDTDPGLQICCWSSEVWKQQK